MSRIATRKRNNDEVIALALQIKADIEHFREHCRAGLTHARSVGQYLTRAKQLLPHGQWGAWLTKHCELSQRSARRYMQIADHWAEINPKRSAMADLTMSAAIELIGKPRTLPTIRPRQGDDEAPGVSQHRDSDGAASKSDDQVTLAAEHVAAASQGVRQQFIEPLVRSVGNIAATIEASADELAFPRGSVRERAVAIATASIIGRAAVVAQEQARVLQNIGVKGDVSRIARMLLMRAISSVDLDSIFTADEEAVA